jgi:tetratricopeptide (TPR) repeat protein
VGPREEWRHTPARLAAALAFAVAIAFGIAAKSRLSEFSDPIVYWESAARAAPHSALAASRVAWRYYEAGRIAEVPAAATRALALDDALAEMYLARGIAYAKQGELRVAEPDLLRAVALEPENADAWTNLARVQRLLGRDAESRDSQQRADRLSSGTTPD